MNSGALVFLRVRRCEPFLGIPASHEFPRFHGKDERDSPYAPELAPIIVFKDWGLFKFGPQHGFQGLERIWGSFGVFGV